MMFVLQSTQRNENGSLQTNFREFATLEEALPLAYMWSEIGSFEEIFIKEGDAVVLDRAAIEELCNTREFHPESLLVAAYRYVTGTPRFAELGYEDLWLVPNGDSIRMNVVSTKDPVTSESPMFSGGLTIPGWQEQYRGRPEALAKVILDSLPVRSPRLSLTITDKRYLFLRALEDLQQLCRSDDEYSMLRIAGLLRLLLWDSSGRSLTSQMKREMRLRTGTRPKLRFRVGQTIRPKLIKDAPKTGRIRLVRSGRVFQAVEDAFCPRTEDEVLLDVDQDQFYRLHVLQVGEHAFTVLELMRHMAYVGGLVHALDPDDERDQALHEFRGLTQVSGVGPGLRTLRSIGRVVFVALLPLRPGGHPKLLHLWPGQIPPPVRRRDR